MNPWGEFKESLNVNEGAKVLRVLPVQRPLFRFVVLGHR